MRPNNSIGAVAVVMVLLAGVLGTAFAANIGGLGPRSAGSGVQVNEGYVVGTNSLRVNGGSWTSGSGTETNAGTVVFTLGQQDGGNVSSADTQVYAQLTGGTASNWVQCSIPSAGNVSCDFFGSQKSMASVTGISVVAQGDSIPVLSPPPNETPSASEARVSGTAVAWGSYSGDGTDTSRSSPVLVSGIGDVVDISAGAEHACVVLEDATARCWGTNWDGRLGDDTTTFRNSPVTVLASSGGSALPEVAQIAAGYTHTCAVLTDTTARCWGSNWGGQLGDGTYTDRSTPAAVRESLGGSPLSGIRKISAGGNGTCALMTDTTIRCWGLGTGNGTPAESLIPVAVHTSAGDSSPLAGVIDIAAAGTHSCAVLSSTEVRCWGSNSRSQLGDGTTTTRNAPVAVLTAPGGSALTGATQISANGGNVFFGGVGASGHTCVIMTDTTVRCWGRNGAGQLGNNTRETASTTNGSGVVTVLAAPNGGALSGVVRVTAGSFHTCVVMVDAVANCWGQRAQGALGDGISDSSSFALTPVTLNLAGIINVSAGERRSMAITTTATGPIPTLNTAFTTVSLDTADGAGLAIDLNPAGTRVFVATSSAPPLIVQFSAPELAGRSPLQLTPPGGS